MKWEIKKQKIGFEKNEEDYVGEREILCRYRNF